MPGQERLRLDILQNRVLALGESNRCVEEQTSPQHQVPINIELHGDKTVVRERKLLGKRGGKLFNLPRGVRKFLSFGCLTKRGLNRPQGEPRI
jgi:hypothetical protein